MIISVNHHYAKRDIKVSAPVNPAVLNRVKAIVVKNLNINEDQVVEDARFNEDLGADSLDIVELVMAFEEEFGCSIPDSEAEKIKTVGDATRYIDTQSAKA